MFVVAGSKGLAELLRAPELPLGRGRELIPLHDVMSLYQKKAPPDSAATTRPERDMYSTGKHRQPILPLQTKSHAPWARGPSHAPSTNTYTPGNSLVAQDD